VRAVELTASDHCIGVACSAKERPEVDTRHWEKPLQDYLDGVSARR